MEPKIVTSRRDRPLSIWREKDSIEGRQVTSLVVILDGPGCRHAASGGCTMCGYNSGTIRSMEGLDLKGQFDKVIDELGPIPYLKLFTSGSFLDPDEIPADVAIHFLEGVRDRSPGSKVLIESRPEFVTENTIERVRAANKKTEIAIGLESSSDKVRSSLVQKGFTWEQFIKAGRIITDKGLGLKTYLLLKPPFLGEQAAYVDTMRSIKDVVREFPGSRLSINPINIQSGTPLENMFNHGFYRPPWLWTVHRVLKEASSFVPEGTHLMSCPTAGGKRRGAHNCGTCDSTLLSAIERFSLDNTSSLDIPQFGCCIMDWKMMMMGSIIDPLMS